MNHIIFERSFFLLYDDLVERFFSNYSLKSTVQMPNIIARIFTHFFKNTFTVRKFVSMVPKNSIPTTDIVPIHLRLNYPPVKQVTKTTEYKYFKPCKLFAYGKTNPFVNAVPVDCFNNGIIDIAPNPLTKAGTKRSTIMAKTLVSKKIYIDPKYLNDPQNWHS